VLIAIGNSPPGDAELLAAARACLDDAAALVRATAVWAVTRLASAAEAAGERGRRLPRESDPMVREEWERIEIASLRSQ
jgi:epoxyqueuosine reductase